MKVLFPFPFSKYRMSPLMATILLLVMMVRSVEGNYLCDTFHIFCKKTIPTPAPTSSPTFCFTADALVTMADGAKKSIASVQKGEQVRTGDGKVGIVTDALVHSINDVVPVATIQTADGVLTGTAHHPIHVGDKWIHMGKAVGMGVSFEDQFVSNFYNLEINGHNIHEELPEMTYSYVVNDIVASGLITTDGIVKTGRRAVVTEEMLRMRKRAYT